MLYWTATLALVFFILNTVSSHILGKQETSYSKYDIKAITNNGDVDYLVCDEGGNNYYFDFYFHIVKDAYAKTINIGPEIIDTNEPVKCVRHNFDATKIMTELPDPGPPGRDEKRIVFIGDSFTYGEAVPAGMAYPNAMNTYLELRGNPNKWNIINYGIIGADLPFIYNVNFKQALNVSPDTIVYTWIPNDTPYHGKRAEFLELYDLINRRNLRLRLRGIPFVKLIRLLLENRRLTSQTLKWYRDIHGPDNKQGMAELRELFAKMKEESNAISADFRVALFPLLIGRPGDYPLAGVHNSVKEILDEEGIKFIDLTDKVLVEPANELWVHNANHHPNVKTHRRAAKALLDYLGIAKTGIENGGDGKTDGPDISENSTALPPVCVAHAMGAADYASMLDALTTELKEYPAGTRFITNSAVVFDIVRNRLSGNIFFDDGNLTETETGGSILQCIYLFYMVVNRDNVRLDFAPDYMSKMTFPEGSLFVIPVNRIFYIPIAHEQNECAHN